MPDSNGEDVRERLGFAAFVGIYTLIILGALGVGLGAYYLTGLQPVPVATAYLGVLFLLAAWGKPWWLSATVRSVDWFSALPNGVLTVLLVAFGILLFWVALAVSPPQELVFPPR